MNNSYGAFLRVNLDVPDKHRTLVYRYITSYSTAPKILSADAKGYEPYWFRVR